MLGLTASAPYNIQTFFSRTCQLLVTLRSREQQVGLKVTPECKGNGWKRPIAKTTKTKVQNGPYQPKRPKPKRPIVYTKTAPTDV